MRLFIENSCDLGVQANALKNLIRSITSNTDQIQSIIVKIVTVVLDFFYLFILLVSENLAANKYDEIKNQSLKWVVST